VAISFFYVDKFKPREGIGLIIGLNAQNLDSSPRHIFVPGYTTVEFCTLSDPIQNCDNSLDIYIGEIILYTVFE
jgi:hypothetical protein